MTASASHSLPAGPRYSIIPAAAVTDTRLQGRDLQVLCLIGRHTDRQGWCRLRQGVAADALKVSRSTVNRSISRLCELGYLEIRQHWRPDGGQGTSSYRVRMDVDHMPDGEFVDVDGDDEGAGDACEPLDVVAPPVANLHTPLCTQDAHPPVHSGCTPLTTPLSNDQKKAQRQKKADGSEGQEAQDLPQAGHRDPGSDPSDDPEQGDEGAERGADADDGALDEERAAARSAAARKAAETRLLHQALNDWPGGVTERRPAIDEAWGGLSAEDKRSAVERIPVYLRRAVAAKHKPGRLARYLADGSWRALPSPKAPRAPEEGPKHLLPWSVVRSFLEHDSARDVLAAACADGVVSLLADAVRGPRRVPSKAEYLARRAEWQDLVRTWRERAGGDEMAPSVLRGPALKWLEGWGEWQSWARGVLDGEGSCGRAPPGGAREAAE